MITTPLAARWLGLLALLVFFPACLALAGGSQPGSIVDFQDLRSQETRESDPDDDSGTAMLELYRRHYNKPDAKPEDLDFDAFLTYQATVSEMHMQEELHKDAETNFAKLIKQREETPNLYYISTWMSSSTTAFDGSGDIRASRRKMTGQSMEMAGRPMYFPSEEALGKILQLTKDTQQAASQVDSEDASLEKFLIRKDELETQLLTVMAEELAKMRESAGSRELYAMGYVNTPDGRQEPLRINLDFLSRFMADRSIAVPGPAGASESRTVQRARNEQILTVQQTSTTQQEVSDTYRMFVNGFDTETKRTEAELKHDLFRLRISPADVRGDELQKTYDPLMTPEYQVGGGLSLPASMPPDEE
jgi:hypothetical protein